MSRELIEKFYYDLIINTDRHINFLFRDLETSSISNAIYRIFYILHLSFTFSKILLMREPLIIDLSYSECLAGTLRLHMSFPSRANEDYAFLSGSWRRARAKVPGVISAIVSVRTKAWELISRRVYGRAP